MTVQNDLLRFYKPTPHWYRCTPHLEQSDHDLSLDVTTPRQAQLDRFTWAMGACASRPTPSLGAIGPLEHNPPPPDIPKPLSRRDSSEQVSSVTIGTTNDVLRLQRRLERAESQLMDLQKTASPDVYRLVNAILNVMDAAERTTPDRSCAPS